jgi:selenocysteine-specific elongation factor
VLAGLDHPVTRRGAYQAYIGAGEHPVRVRVLGAGAEIAPGGEGLVRLHLATPLPLLPGDRYVLRESGREETVGGGEVLDVAPVLPAAKAQPSRSVARVVAERGWVDAAVLERLTGEAVPPTLGPWVVDPAALAAAQAEVAAAIEAAGPLGLDLAALDERARLVLETLDVAVSDGRAGAQSRVDQSHPFAAALAASPFAPPGPEGFDRAEVRELVRRGLVVERDGVYFAPEAVERAAAIVAGLLAASPEGVTASAIREALGTSRKYLLPLLGVLDSTGVTRRRGDLRIPGPRLPSPGGPPATRSS